MRILAFAFVVLVALATMVLPAAAEKRVALVIGNGAYQSVAALPNPPRDAEVMAAMFRAAGFDDVRVETNVGVAAMRRALRAFADKAADADTAVVFFAGHGVEIGGRNYLAALATDIDVEDEAIDLDRVLQLLDPVKRLKLVILDACRENPFASRMKLTTASRSVGRGLAPPEPQTSNTLVAYAARAGAVAADGDGHNSPFTAALVNNLTKPGLDVRIALGLVHDEVLQATGRRQEPFLYGALGGGTLALASPAPALQPQQQVAAVTPVAPPVPTGPCGGAAVASLSTRSPGSLSRQEECALKARDEFKECEKCPVMVVVPAGSFTMGSPQSEPGRVSDESPQHVVTFAKPFAVGKFQVTLDEFSAFVSATGYDAGSTCSIWEGDLRRGKWVEKAGRSWRNPGFGQIGSHPAACLNWKDAQAYVAWVKQRTGKDYRLLSEAEFEYAARGQIRPGSYPRYYFGNDEKEMCRYGNGADQTAKQKISGTKDWSILSCSDGYAYTSPVGSFLPSGFGLYDMHGNVWQWTEDCYHDTYAGAPTDGEAWTTGDCSYRVLRGGSWFNGPTILRAAFRIGANPDARVRLNGFRLARTDL